MLILTLIIFHSLCVKYTEDLSLYIFFFKWERELPFQYIYINISFKKKVNNNDFVKRDSTRVLYFPLFTLLKKKKKFLRTFRCFSLFCFVKKMSLLLRKEHYVLEQFTKKKKKPRNVRKKKKRIFNPSLWLVDIDDVTPHSVCHKNEDWWLVLSLFFFHVKKKKRNEHLWFFKKDTFNNCMIIIFFSPFVFLCDILRIWGSWFVAFYVLVRWSFLHSCVMV